MLAGLLTGTVALLLTLFYLSPYELTIDEAEEDDI